MNLDMVSVVTGSRGTACGAPAGSMTGRTRRSTNNGRVLKSVRFSRSEETPSAKRKRTLSVTDQTGRKRGRGSSISLQSFPPELLDQIISYLSVKEVVALGQTCQYFKEICNSDGIWRKICKNVAPRLTKKEGNESNFWKRAAILNYTKGLFFQTFGGRRRIVSKTVAPHLSHGYWKFIPTKDHVFILDYSGTLFFLKNALVSSSLGQIQWKKACRYVVLCRNVKDFATDPRNDTIYRKYLYVLATRDLPPGVPTEVHSTMTQQCDCVEVYLQSSGQRVFKMTFHSSMKFKQIRLVGQETDRSLVLLTEEGKIYSLTVNEMQLDQPRSYTVQLSLRKITKCLPHVSVSQVYSNQSSVVYITENGTVYLEVHTAGVYRDLFGTLHAFDPLDQQMPLALSLSSKVLACSLGYNHLGLVDEYGRIFMQGNNRYGQLGTGDKIDRGEPTQVHYLKRPTDIFCGLNHSLVLFQSSDSSKEIHGCGCGAGGRLPGWPKGSASFVKLQVQVPQCAKALCSTRECLYMLACYDISDCPSFKELPPTKTRFQGGDSEAEAAQACEDYLGQLHRCSTLEEQMAKLKEVVGHMSLFGFQKDFFWEALDMMQRSTVNTLPQREATV